MHKKLNEALKQRRILVVMLFLLLLSSISTGLFGFNARFQALYKPNLKPTQYGNEYVLNLMERHGQQTGVTTYLLTDPSQVERFAVAANCSRAKYMPFVKANREDIYQTMRKTAGATLFFIYEKDEVINSGVQPAPEGQFNKIISYRVQDLLVFNILSKDALPQIAAEHPECVLHQDMSKLKALSYTSGGAISGPDVLVVGSFFARIYCSNPQLDAVHMERLADEKLGNPDLAILETVTPFVPSWGRVSVNSPEVFEGVRKVIFSRYHRVRNSIIWGGSLLSICLLGYCFVCFRRFHESFSGILGEAKQKFFNEFGIGVKLDELKFIVLVLRSKIFLGAYFEARLEEYRSKMRQQKVLRREYFKLLAARSRVEALIERLDKQIFAPEIEKLLEALQADASVTELDRVFHEVCIVRKNTWLRDLVGGNGSKRLKKTDLEVLMDRFELLPENSVKRGAMAIYLHVLCSDLVYEEALKLMKVADALQKLRISPDGETEEAEGEIETVSMGLRDIASQIFPIAKLSTFIPISIDTEMVWEILVILMRLGIPVREYVTERVLQTRVLANYEQFRFKKPDKKLLFQTVAWLVKVKIIVEHRDHASQGVAYSAVLVPGKAESEHRSIVSMMREAREVSIKGFDYQLLADKV